MVSPVLPVEIVIMIFKHVDDKQTMKNIRLAVSWGREYIDESILYDTLRLDRNRRHAWNRVRGMVESDLLQHVRTLILCTSSYAVTKRVDSWNVYMPYLDDLYPEKRAADFTLLTPYQVMQRSFEPSEPDRRFDNIEDAHNFAAEAKGEHIMIPQVQHYVFHKYIAFIRYTVRLLVKHNGNRKLLLEIQSDMDDQTLIDCMRLETPSDSLHAPAGLRGFQGEGIRNHWLKWFKDTFRKAIVGMLYSTDLEKLISDVKASENFDMGLDDWPASGFRA